MTPCFVRLFGAVLTVLAVTACSSTSTYNASYLAAARRPATMMSDGKALVVTTPPDDAYVYTGNPTSFTGSATTLTIPLGSIVRETAVAAFTDTFKGGADLAGQVTDPSRYAVIVAPKLVSYSYEYNQLKNVGFAITPTAVVSVDVRVLDAKGATRWQRTYASGPVEGPAYMLNTAPEEEVSKVTHKALYDMFSKAAGDVAREVVIKPS